MNKEEAVNALQLANTLAEFANLKPADVAVFRKAYPNFAGHDWWDGMERRGDETESKPSWLGLQETVRKAWENHFSPDTCIALIVHGSNLSIIGETVRHLNEDLVAMEGPEAWQRMKSFARAQVFDYQRAVMFLHVQPWRASRCLNGACGKLFAKDAKGRLFCSQTCYNANRSEDKRRWWNEVGTKQRAKKNRTKKKPRK
jgi:hypothetical protein